MWKKAVQVDESERSLFWVLHGLLRLLWSRTQISRTWSCGSKWDGRFALTWKECLENISCIMFPLLSSWTVGLVWDSSQGSAYSNPGCTLLFCPVISLHFSFTVSKSTITDQTSTVGFFIYILIYFYPFSVSNDHKYNDVVILIYGHSNFILLFKHACLIFMFKMKPRQLFHGEMFSNPCQHLIKCPEIYAHGF